VMLLVGGPMDGDRGYVRELQPSIRVPLPGSMAYAVYEAHCFCANDKDTYIYAAEGMSDLEVMEALIEGYKPHE
jgi:hypothetical protein